MDELEAVFLAHGVCHRTIIHAAFCIMELEEGGKSAGIKEVIVQCQRRPGTAWLDFAIDLLKFMPECPKERRKIDEYARGIGKEVWAVRKFKQSVPEEVWLIGARIANRV